MENNSSATATTDKSAIQLLYRQLINSWNEYNSDAYAALFADGGSIVGFDGSQANGRQEIHDHLSAIFADHQPAKFITIVREVRLLSPTVGLLRAVAGMIPPEKKK